MGRDSTHNATADHVSAHHNRPPFRQPIHAATARIGANTINVCSMGTMIRNCGIAGTNRKTARAGRRRRHPRSRGAASAVVTA
jgi:hypothetical protein